MTNETTQKEKPYAWLCVAGPLMILGILFYPDPRASKAETTQLEQASEPVSAAKGCKRGKKRLGEACIRDNACRSVECREFTCQRRARPFLSEGRACKFDGDCCSGECSLFKCQAR